MLLAVLPKLMVRPFCWRLYYLYQLGEIELVVPNQESHPYWLEVFTVLEGTMHTTGGESSHQYHPALSPETYKGDLPVGYTGVVFSKWSDPGCIAHRLGVAGQHKSDSVHILSGYLFVCFYFSFEREKEREVRWGRSRMSWGGQII